VKQFISRKDNRMTTFGEGPSPKHFFGEINWAVLLSFLAEAFPIFDEFMYKLSSTFVTSCLFSESSLVRSAAWHNVVISRRNLIISRNASFFCHRYGWKLDNFFERISFWHAKYDVVSLSTFEIIDIIVVLLYPHILILPHTLLKMWGTNKFFGSFRSPISKMHPTLLKRLHRPWLPLLLWGSGGHTPGEFLKICM
jgi:hypothetical protein